MACKSKNISDFSCADIKCKLLNVEYNSEMYFIPLIHTLENKTIICKSHLFIKLII